MTDSRMVIIFGGTSEGRELAEYAAGRGIPVLVSVVSEYGRNLMTEGDCLRIHCGRLDEEQMVCLLRRERPAMVLDATHPHAAEVTRQLNSACKRTEIKYLRVVREPAQQEAGRQEPIRQEAERQKPTQQEAGRQEPIQWEEERQELMQQEPGDAGVYWVDTVRQAAELLQLDQEPVLLTTGSKELPLFAEDASLRERIFARVLPDSKVLAFCEQLGIAGKHLIAMQGPFSREMNRALIRQTKAGWLVTKESGDRGGFEEKLAVIKECKINGIVIRRPHRESGISPETAKRALDELLSDRKRAAGQNEMLLSGGECAAVQNEKFLPGGEHGGTQNVRLSLIGMGMGMGKQLTAEAMEALRSCEAVLGAPRMLSDLSGWTKGRQTAPVYLGKDVYEWIQKHPGLRHIAVVYSGDTGFHSGSRKLCELIRAEADSGNLQAAGIEIKIYPGISTAACLCARLQTTWEDLYFASAHGCECDAAALVREHRRVFLLLGGELTMGDLCTALTKAGCGNVLVKAGERLGYENERIISGRAEEFCTVRTDSLTAVILERNDG